MRQQGGPGGSGGIRVEPQMRIRVEPQVVGRLVGMEGIWPVFFLLVVLKIPVFGMIWLLWWANPDNAKPEASTDDGGSSRVRPGRPPRHPFGPRRGPHGGGIPVSPEPSHARRPHHADALEAKTRARESSRSLASRRK